MPSPQSVVLHRALGGPIVRRFAHDLAPEHSIAHTHIFKIACWEASHVNLRVNMHFGRSIVYTRAYEFALGEAILCKCMHEQILWRLIVCTITDQLAPAEGELHCT